MQTIAFTTSVRVPSGRLLIHVTAQALRHWGAAADASSQLATFAERAPQIHALALALSERDADCSEVLIDEDIARSQR